MPSHLRFFFTVALDMAHGREVSVFGYSRATGLPWQDAELVLESLRVRELLEAAPDSRSNNPTYRLTPHGKGVRSYNLGKDFAGFSRELRELR